MGFFSWKTDKGVSISNIYSSRGSFTVYLVTPWNKKIEESFYEGYGVFGGRDAYALLAQWNEPSRCSGDDHNDRFIGLELTFERPDDIKFPLKFTEDKDARYEDLPASERCEDQGYFYDDDDGEM